MNAETQVEKINTISSLDELAGFESAAKLRGILPEELAAIHQKRKDLTPRKRRKR